MGALVELTPRSLAQLPIKYKARELMNDAFEVV